MKATQKHRQLGTHSKQTDKARMMNEKPKLIELSPGRWVNPAFVICVDNGGVTLTVATAGWSFWWPKNTPEEKSICDDVLKKLIP